MRFAFSHSVSSLQVSKPIFMMILALSYTICKQPRELLTSHSTDRSACGTSCLYCENGKCLDCKQGYILSKLTPQCEKCSMFCKTCKKSPEICSSCYSGFAISEEDYQCKVKHKHLILLGTMAVMIVIFFVIAGTFACYFKIKSYLDHHKTQNLLAEGSNPSQNIVFSRPSFDVLSQQDIGRRQSQSSLSTVQIQDSESQRDTIINSMFDSDLKRALSIDDSYMAQDKSRDALKYQKSNF